MLIKDKNNNIKIITMINLEIKKYLRIVFIKHLNVINKTDWLKKLKIGLFYQANKNKKWSLRKRKLVNINKWRNVLLNHSYILEVEGVKMH